MVLKKFQVSIPLHNEVDSVINVIIEGLNGLLYPLLQVTPEQMDTLQKRLDDPARPLFWCMVDRAIIVHPRPDKDYDKLKVRYTLPPRLLGESLEMETGSTEISFGSKPHSRNDR